MTNLNVILYLGKNWIRCRKFLYICNNLNHHAIQILLANIVIMIALVSLPRKITLIWGDDLEEFHYDWHIFIMQVLIHQHLAYRICLVFQI